MDALHWPYPVDAGALSLCHLVACAVVRRVVELFWVWAEICLDSLVLEIWELISAHWLLMMRML